MNISFETVCEVCGAEFENIEHPLKPGVIMQRRCKCVYEFVASESGTVTILRALPKDGGHES